MEEDNSFKADVTSLNMSSRHKSIRLQPQYIDTMIKNSEKASSGHLGPPEINMQLNKLIKVVEQLNTYSAF